MAGPVSVSIQGIPETEEQMRRLPPDVRDRLRAAVAQQTIDLKEGVKAAVAEIFKSTGPLYQSINAEMTEDTSSVTGRVFSSGVVYAAAQEYGGTWTIPELFPVNASVLAFIAPAKLGFSSGGGSNRHTAAYFSSDCPANWAKSATWQS